MTNEISKEAQDFFAQHNIAVDAERVELGYLNSEGITDEHIGYLAELKSLEILNLEGSDISDVSALRNHGKLKDLYLGQTRVPKEIRNGLHGNIAEQLNNFYTEEVMSIMALRRQGVIETPAAQLAPGSSEVIAARSDMLEPQK